MKLQHIIRNSFYIFDHKYILYILLYEHWLEIKKKPNQANLIKNFILNLLQLHSNDFQHFGHNLFIMCIVSL